jgi:hypothetical protein
MENVENQQQKQPQQIKSGKYEFYITGVIRKDSNGYDLKTKTGNTYQRLKIVLLGTNENYDTSKFIFGSKDIQEVVSCINNPALTDVFQKQGKDFELETLIGEGGILLMGNRIKEGVTWPQIECLIKPKENFNAPNKQKEMPLVQNINSLPSSEPLDDDVPF